MIMVMLRVCFTYDLIYIQCTSLLVQYDCATNVSIQLVMHVDGTASQVKQHALG